MFIAGEPAVFWGKGDHEWREVVRASGLSGLDTLSLRFVVSSWRRRGNWFDLENLVVTAGHQADHRVRDLRVRTDSGCMGATVAVWLL